MSMNPVILASSAVSEPVELSGQGDVSLNVWVVPINAPEVVGVMEVMEVVGVMEVMEVMEVMVVIEVVAVNVTVVTVTVVAVEVTIKHIGKVPLNAAFASQVKISDFPAQC